MPNIGIGGLVLILVIALLLFGPSKLPQLGKAVGQTIHEFRNAGNEAIEDEKGEKEKAAVKERVE
ncbi:MAG: twin-arginine translocase TatA/TatE family subunit [Firmicutes bacterium]|nr:twin-arginine translocase TatA/TatE family subunit [Bacillota bacterium]